MQYIKQFARIVGVGIFAFWATGSLFSLTRAQDYTQQSVLFLLLYALIAWQMWSILDIRLWERPHRRVTAASLALALCFSAFTVVGDLLHKTESLAFTLKQAEYMAGMASLFFVILWRFLQWTSRNAEKPGASPSPRPILFWLLSLGLFLCWLPAFFAMFPGVMSPDSFMQMYQAVGYIPLADGHPVIHTWLVAACVQIGALLNIHVTTTPALYGLAQMLLMAAACAYATVTMLRMKAPPLFAGITYAFFALFPVNAVYSVTMWKDIPHAAVTLLLVACLLQWSQNPKRLFGSWARMIPATLLLFFFSTFRQNGLIAFVLFIPFFLWFFRGYWKRASLLCLSVFALLGIYRGSLSLLNVIPPQPGEALSVPMQLAARVVRDHRDTLPIEEEEILREIFPVDDLPRLYMPRLADPVKYHFNAGAFGRSPGRYMALFARLMRRYPGVAAESFLLGNYGYWYPAASYWVMWGGVPANDLNLSRRSILFSEEMFHSLEAAIRNTPGISMLLSIGIMMWMLLLAAAVCWVNRRKEWPPFVLLLGLWLTLLFMPVFAEYRYAYGLILCAPVCLSVMLGKTR